VSREQVAKARALLDVGRADEAASVLVQLLASQPGNQEAWCLLGAAHLRSLRSAESIECARRAVELGPGLEWPHRIVSAAELQRGDVPAAIAAARESVRLAPGLPIAHAHLGDALSRGGVRRWREAEREAATAISLAPADAAVHFIAGNVALRQRRRKRAEQRFAKALEIDPTSAAALNNLSLARLRRGLAVSAASGFGQAAALDPTTDLHRRNLESAVTHLLAYVAIALGGVAIVSVLNSGAGLAALGVVGLGVLAVAGRAQRQLGPAAWRYARRVPLEKGITYMVAVQAAMLAAAPFAGGGSEFAVLPLLFGARVLAQVGFRRIAR
jgi:tetratricopeptide (TPR) repeat protein